MNRSMTPLGRLLLRAGTLGLLALLLGPAALASPVARAADQHDEGQRPVLMAVDGDLTLPAGEEADTIMVVGGTATILGHARTVIVIDGTARLDGATVGTVVAMSSPVSLGSGTEVSGDVLTLSSPVTRAAGVQVDGSVRDMSADIAGLGLALGAMVALLYLGFALATIGAGLLLAALAARQIRAAEALISREPLNVLAAAILGLVVGLVGAVVAISTVIGAPIGLGILLGLAPAAAFAGYLIAGIWIGDFILRRTSSNVVRDRPYLASVVGLVTLLILGVLPFVTAIASLFGTGAIVLLAWRTLRATPAPVRPIGPTVPAAPGAA